MSDNTGSQASKGLFTRATRIERNEFLPTALSFGFVFLLMTAYFPLRAVRDSLASDWTDVELSLLWSSTFFLSVVAVMLYGLAITYVRFSRLVPLVYAFFAASFFGLVFLTQSIANPSTFEKVFYVWLSVFSLFHLSVFWSFMSDTFNREQAQRLFAIIATGASTGAIAGPALAATLSGAVGNVGLMIMSAGLLLLPIPIIFTLMRLKRTALGNSTLQADLSNEQAIGRNPFRGFSLFFQSRFLLGIGVFIVLYVAISTFIYFELKTLLEIYSREERTEIWALIDLAVNSLTLFTAWFITSRITTRFGMSTTLALIPLLVVLGMLVIALSPVVAVVAAMQVARRAGNYAVTRPGREMLFTMVDRETRFKVKPVIDIVLYRGGDMATAWAFTLLTTIFGLGLGAIAAVGAAVAAAWAMVGARLGRQYQKLTEKTAET